MLNTLGAQNQILSMMFRSWRSCATRQRAKTCLQDSMSWAAEPKRLGHVGGAAVRAEELKSRELGSLRRARNRSCHGNGDLRKLDDLQL